jgi:hypothetical protein
MPAPKPRTLGDTLRDARDRFDYLAELADIETRSISVRQQLHDDIETVVGDVRASVRGRR